MPPSLVPGSRWRALDVFRGLVIFGMILVNAADLGGHSYAWLRHAGWDGCTFADGVFPAFLFIMGVAMGVSLHGHASRLPLHQVHARIARRALTLFALGVLLNSFFAHGLGDLRVMGVLQRLGICYWLAAGMLLHMGLRAQLLAAGGLLLGYALLLGLAPVPQLAGDASPIANNLPAYIDRWLLGPTHLLREYPYAGRIDPEGVLATLPALVNVLFGAAAGRVVAAAALGTATTLRLAGLGIVSCTVGLLLGTIVPINKVLWTSSFVLLTSGLGSVGFALCYELVDVRGSALATRLLEVLGLNAIAAYLLSTALDALALRVTLETRQGTQTLYDCWLSATNVAPAHAAFAFAALQAIVVWGCAQLMHARGWYLKI